MAETTITALPAASAVAATDVIPADIASAGATQKVTIQNLVTEGLKAPGAIGGTTPNTGAFTTLSASSTVSGTGFSTYLASPPAIGGSSPAAGNFTTLGATGNVTLGDASGDSVVLNAATVTANNSTAISAVSGKTLTLNGGGGTNGVVLSVNNYAGFGTASPGCSVDVAGTVRATSQTAPSSGAGFELLYAGGTGYAIAYDRTGTAFSPVVFQGSTVRFDSNGVPSLTVVGANVYAGAGTTTMTSGFFYIPAAAGAPTGVPTSIAGRLPMYYDSTNNKFYIYNGAWKSVALA